jgi:DNA-binding transcriptional LysR family regulator
MLPPGHPMLGKKALRFDDMVGEALVTTSKESALRINLDHLMEKYDYHPQIVCESNDINLIIRAVKSGLGFAILPRSIVFSNPSIIKYCVESSLPDTFGDIGLSYSTSEDDARDASQFISFVKNFTEKYKEEYYSKNIWELHPDNEK